MLISSVSSQPSNTFNNPSFSPFLSPQVRSGAYSVPPPKATVSQLLRGQSKPTARGNGEMRLAGGNVEMRLASPTPVSISSPTQVEAGRKTL